MVRPWPETPERREPQKARSQGRAERKERRKERKGRKRGKAEREERQKERKGRKRGKARGAPPRTPPGGMIPPGPPQLAGRKGKGRQRPSFDSLLFWGVPGAQANAPPHAVRRKGRRARRCRILWPPGAERPGTPRAGGYLSVSVSCRTRSRRPTPSRPAPGRRVKGKISRQGGVERGLCFIRRPSSEKVWLNAGCFLFVLELPCINAGTGLCLRRIALSSTHCPASVCKEHSRLHAASVCKGQPCISAPFSLSFAKVGRITTLQGPRVPSGTRAAGHK